MPPVRPGERRALRDLGRPQRARTSPPEAPRLLTSGSPCLVGADAASAVLRIFRTCARLARPGAPATAAAYPGAPVVPGRAPVGAAGRRRDQSVGVAAVQAC